MGYPLTDRDVKRMDGLHPSLRKVVFRAAEITTVQFFVNETVRSEEQCRINYGKGRTAAECRAKGIDGKYAQPRLGKVTWLINPYNSKHCKQPDGFGHAVDLYAFPFNQNQPRSQTFKIADAMIRAAKELGVAMRWGKDWDRDGIYEEKGETDGPHFELC